MDIEKSIRFELMAALEGDFLCYEEVRLKHPLFPTHIVRADVVAIPLDEDFHDITLAFEVKAPTQEWNFADWCECIQQASDYVLGRVTANGPTALASRRVNAAFLYPAPPYVRACKGQVLNREIEHSLMLTGAMHLSSHRRVGSCSVKQYQDRTKAELSIGPGEIWNSDRGWFSQARGVLAGKRRVGSQKINVLAELDGCGNGLVPPPAPWE